MRYIAVLLICGVVSGCPDGGVEFRDHLLASVPPRSSANPTQGILSPCDPCRELQLFASATRFNTVKAAVQPVLVLERDDIERVEIVESAIRGDPEERYFGLLLVPSSAAEPRLAAFVEEHALHALAVTSDGVRGGSGSERPDL